MCLKASGKESLPIRMKNTYLPKEVSGIEVRAVWWPLKPE
jgi:hypothetical protein